MPGVVSARLEEGWAEEVHSRLVRRAYLFDDPSSYVSGVEAALEALRAPSALGGDPLRRTVVERELAGTI